MSFSGIMKKEQADTILTQLNWLKQYNKKMTKHQALIITISLLRTEHYICPEDAWYSCPESGASLNHHVTKCDCGFDAYNAKVNQIIEYIQST